MANILECLLVLAAFVLVYTVPTFIVARRLGPGDAWFGTLLNAWTFGLSSQAVLGLLWNHGVGRQPHLEVVVWLSLWLVLSLTLGRRRPGPLPAFGRVTAALLLGILLIGVIGRSLYPLQHWALGQSDAYSHLQFLRDIGWSGRIRNPAYPPGYHWVLALPTLLFHLDPYLVVRYVGAFFGAVLALAVGALAVRMAGRPAGLASVFLVSCFPGFMLLAKTGVGAFANQLGLALLPVLIFHYLGVTDAAATGRRREVAGFALAAAGLAGSVPLLLVSAVMALMLERGISAWRSPAKPFICLSGMAALAVLPAVMILLIHVGQAEARGTRVPLAHVVDVSRAGAAAKGRSGDGPKPSERSTFNDHRGVRLAVDFLTVKRLGLGSPGANAAVAGILVLFVGTAGWGLRRRRPALVLLGVWGGLCAVQTAVGWLEFSRYQRAGWSLLIALAWLGGVVYGAIDARAESRRSWLRALAMAGGALLGMAFLLRPPVHRHGLSPAEDNLVKTVRAMAFEFHARAGERGDGFSLVRPGLSAPLTDLPRAGHFVIVSRPFTGFQGRQGDPIAAILGRPSGVKLKTFQKNGDPYAILSPGACHIFLTDNATRAKPDDFGAWGRIDTRVSKTFARWQSRRYDVNQDIDAFTAVLDREGWVIGRGQVGSDLKVAIVRVPSAGPQAGDS